MSSADVLLALKVAVGGRELADLDLVSVRVERALCTVSRTTLRLNDPGFTVAAGSTFGIGTSVTVAAGDQQIFSGAVTGVSLEQHVGEGTDFVVVADDLAHKLGVGVKPVAYVNRSYADTLTELCRDAGLTVRAPGLAMRGVNEYVLRTGNGLEFLDAVTRRTNTVWWVDGTTLHVEEPQPAEPAATLTLGDDLTDFSVRASGLRPTGARVSGWNPASQTTIIGVATPPSTAGAAEFVNSYVGDGPERLGAGPASTADPSPATDEEAKTIASALLADAASAAVIARGSCRANPAVKPGATVAVADAGPASGNYWVSEVEHGYDRRGLVTRFVAGPRRPSGLVDVLGRPPADPGLALSGLVAARISDNNDPDQHGRVKVKFMALDGEIDSAWARVVTIGAGAQRGFVVQPEVNDEVLVGFEFGDSRRPVVIGGLFSPKNTLPQADNIVSEGKVGYRRITSRKNHVIEIADGEEPGTQYIKLGLGTAEHTLLLGADKFEVQVAEGKPATIKAGSAQFAISAAGDVTIEGNNVTIKAKQNIQLEGLAGAALKSDGQTQVQGTMLDLKGQASGSVDGGAMLALKGGLVQIN